MQHRTQADLEQADFTSSASMLTSPEGKVLGYGTTVGNGIEGWAPGASFRHTDGAAGAQVYTNEGTKTTANWQNSLVWANGTVFTAKILGGGTDGSPLTTGTASLKFVEFRCSSSASSGDNRLAYMRYQLTGGGGGECVRGSTVVKSNVGTAHGAHFGIEFLATAGASECSGLGVGLRGTLMIPNVASWAPTGTYSAGMFEIFSEGTNSDPAGMTELSVLRLVNSGGSGKADVDTDAFLFSIQGFAVDNEAADLVHINSITAATINANVTEALKIKIGANTRYIPIATATT